MFSNPDLLHFVFGRLTLEALPLDQPILVGTFVVVALGGIAVLGALTYFRVWRYLWREWFTSVDHKRIGVMYIILGTRDAAARLRRRAHDARPAGDRVQRLGRLPAAASLRPDLHRARRDHDLLRGDAAGHGADELRRAAADRRARRRLSVPQQLQLLDDRRRRRAGHDVAVRRRVRAHRLARLSAALGASPTAPMSASITTSGRCRSRASARCYRAST